MNRRAFLKSTAVASSLAAISGSSAIRADHHQKQRLFFELRKWIISAPEKRAFVSSYLESSLVPALNRAGVKPVGVFYPEKEEDHSIYALVPFASLDQFAGLTAALIADQAFIDSASDYLNTEKSDPAYQRIESSLMRAFEGFPGVERPLEGQRIFELRIYESHNEKKGVLKVEMFNQGEFDVFRNVGFNMVFFGQTLIGAGRPSLQYMLAYRDHEDRSAAWKRFSTDPGWQELKGVERYKDTVSKIISEFLVPASFSQI